jgi:16S rRNA C967 or C1407 C5-methylase (RsmB/RsmF family)
MPAPVFPPGLAHRRAGESFVMQDPTLAMETAEVPESMRTILGLDVPPHDSPPEATDAASAANASPRRHLRRPYEAPRPSEKELSELEQAIHNMPADFDAVLVDAPCSGTGVCRRRPDFGWRMNPELLKGHLREQAAILRAAARYVRPGGRLLYATCSILPEENEEQILSFLKDDPRFEPLDMTPALLHHALDHRLPEYGAFWLTILPHRQPGDGFFMALLRRKSQ